MDRLTRRDWLEASASFALSLTLSSVLPACTAPVRSSSILPRRDSMPFDIAIVGGGPAGLSAALLLGRACKRVVLFDAGPPRNAAAAEIHGFVTRDGTPPAEFRRIGREQLQPYDVEVRDARVEAIERAGASFHVRTAAGAVEARRVVLCTGMIDELPALPGYRELWGKSIFQCPYCHGWEIRGRAFGYIASATEWLSWAPFLTGWSDDVVVFTSGQFVVPAQVADDLVRARIRIEERPVVSLRARDGQLAAVEARGRRRGRARVPLRAPAAAPDTARRLAGPGARRAGVRASRPARPDLGARHLRRRRLHDHVPGRARRRRGRRARGLHAQSRAHHGARHRDPALMARSAKP